MADRHSVLSQYTHRKGIIMRVLITGGGTAGHVNPALAIAAAIQARDDSAVVEYVGTEKGIEGRLVSRNGMKLHTIEVYGLKRSLSPANVKVLFKALEAKKKCKAIIREFKPDVVIGTGGYVCWPLIAAASELNIPTVLHEANAEPGFAIKTLKKKVDLILVNFESTKKHLKGVKNRVLRVGMPVKSEFYTSSSDRLKTPKTNVDEKKEIHILSFGGSLGARQLNLAVLALMNDYLRDRPHIKIEHACGAREFEYIRSEFEKFGLDRYENIVLSDYIYDMPSKMAKADLVIVRSGASTLAEIAASGTAAILIPSPNVTGDQQRKNARAFCEKGAAIMIEDSEATEKLGATVLTLLEEKGYHTLLNMSEKVKEFGMKECDDLIYRSIVELVEKNKEC